MAGLRPLAVVARVPHCGPPRRLGDLNGADDAGRPEGGAAQSPAAAIKARAR
jgi:hypothetical protein